MLGSLNERFGHNLLDDVCNVAFVLILGIVDSFDEEEGTLAMARYPSDMSGPDWALAASQMPPAKSGEA